MKKHCTLLSEKPLIRYLVLFSIYVVLFCCFIGFAKTSRYQQLLLGIVPFCSLGCLAVCLLRGDYARRGSHWFVLAYLAWILITFLSRGMDAFSQKVNQISFLEQCAICCIALPFSHLTGDSGRRRLDRFLLLVISVAAVCIWLCLLGTLRGRDIVLWRPALTFGATYTSTGRLMLRVMSLHYYHLGYLAVICFFSTLYLAAAHPKPALIPLWTILLLTFGSAVLLTYSRTGVLALLCGLLLAFHVLLQKFCPRKAIRRTVFALILIGGVLLTGVGMNFIYKAVHSIRDIWHGLSTLSSRTEIWSGGVHALITHPYALVFGFPLDTAMQTINESIPLTDYIAHMHSGFMQALVLVGVPGLLFIIAFFFRLFKCSLRLFFADSTSYALKLLILIPFSAVCINFFEGILLYGQSGQILLSIITAMVSGYLFDAFHKSCSHSQNAL